MNGPPTHFMEQAQLPGPEIQQLILDDLDKADVAANVEVKLLLETLTHCAEPVDSEALFIKVLGGDAAEEALHPATSLEEKEREEATRQQEKGRFRVKFDGRSYPERHHTWPEDLRLLVDDDHEYFVVLKSSDAQPEADSKVYHTTFAPNDPKTRVGEFGYRYACGNRARDEHNELKGQENNEIKFNYAEHKMMGEMLHLKWPRDEITDGMRELSLPNGVKLTYGEINGLGGDFFGGFTPISNGKDFNHQCTLFKEAFNTLGNSVSASMKVQKLLQGRQQEVDAIAQAVKDGQSTFKAYKDLVKPAKIGPIDVPGLSQGDLNDQLNTATGDGPSYLRLAQINLDHFGQDAVTAYNAGQYCALKAAAEGNLELGYAMNAFADHYLGDCFASGHFRTPRRILHGSTDGWEAAWSALSGMVQNKREGGEFLKGAMKVMVPDLLSMLMHNEDNALGITVTNKQGTKFTIWGDKQLFESKNAKNKEIMKQALQASVDEVYEAFESKTANPPADRLSYRAWNYAPLHVVDSEGHSPLFIQHEFSWWDKIKLKGVFEWPIKVRQPFSDPHSKNYVPVGTTPSLIKLYNDISSSEQWKNY
ncbi:phosphatidylcholine-hydrolyzing phospholipase c [Fusarium beomiforme]|uniref:Phosphatidylcholine-hydrolyzing phospholipase c n=1 Tax=Fusarium beomiforme TaxID=44412 RepID=A0A9P5DU45_9HYPO|nr:phosphatidylcholine-hydrolyzing phospholipase c [Fusarium beomiforme]